MKHSTYKDTQANKDMPNRMACHTHQIKFAREKLFREPFGIDCDTTEIHQGSK